MLDINALVAIVTARLHENMEKGTFSLLRYISELAVSVWLNEIDDNECIVTTYLRIFIFFTDHKVIHVLEL